MHAGSTSATELVAHSGTSMLPAIRPGDILECGPCPEHLSPGDIIRFTVPQCPVPVVHRVAEVLPDSCVRTRGDNSRQSDPWIVPRSAILDQPLRVQRGARTTVLAHGSNGLAQARAARARGAMRASVTAPLRPLYNALARTGLVHAIVPRSLRAIPAQFTVNDTTATKLIWRGSQVGELNTHAHEWSVRFPFRLLASPRALEPPLRPPVQETSDTCRTLMAAICSAATAPYAFTEPARCDRILSLAQRNHLCPALYHALRPTLSMPEAERFLSILRNAYLENVAVHEHMRRRNQGILSALRESSLEFIVLKGLHIAHVYYPAPADRPMNDLDILIRKPDLPRAQSVLAKAGFYQKNGTASIDLHWTLAAESDGSSQALEEAWRTSQMMDFDIGECRVLCPEQLMVFVCAHAAAHHTFDMAPLRSLLDLHRILLRDGDRIDPVLLERFADAWGARRSVAVMGDLLSELAPGGLDPALLARLREFDRVSAEVRTWALARIARADPAPSSDLSPFYWRLWRGSLWSRLGALRDLLVPASARIANEHATPAGSPSLALRYATRIAARAGFYAHTTLAWLAGDQGARQLMREGLSTARMREYLRKR